MFHNTKNKLVDLALMGMMVALLEVVKVSLMVVPNVELVSLLIVICTIVIGKKTFLVVIAFSIIECFLWGFGIWNIGYIYVWPILVLVALLFRNIRNPLVWAIVLGFFGLSFGGLFAITNLVISGKEAAIAYWISGLMFDIIHCISNFVLTLILFKPLYSILRKIWRE